MSTLLEESLLPEPCSTPPVPPAQTPFNKLCETFDVGRKNQLGLAEFIGVCAFLKASKAVFIAFDQARTGRITLDFNQFCYAAAHTR